MKERGFLKHQAFYVPSHDNTRLAEHVEFISIYSTYKAETRVRSHHLSCEDNSDTWRPEVHIHVLNQQ